MKTRIALVLALAGTALAAIVTLTHTPDAGVFHYHGSPPNMVLHFSVDGGDTWFELNTTDDPFGHATYINAQNAQPPEDVDVTFDSPPTTWPVVATKVR